MNSAAFDVLIKNFIKLSTSEPNKTDIRHVDIGIEYCRYWVLFRSLTVPNTVTITDTCI